MAIIQLNSQQGSSIVCPCNYCTTTTHVPLCAVSFLGGFRTPAAEYAALSLKRPASETLHNNGSELSFDQVGQAFIREYRPALVASSTPVSRFAAEPIKERLVAWLIPTEQPIQDDKCRS
jgi:hypothetical protein